MMLNIFCICIQSLYSCLGCLHMNILLPHPQPIAQSRLWWTHHLLWCTPPQECQAGSELSDTAQLCPKCILTESSPPFSHCILPSQSVGWGICETQGFVHTKAGTGMAKWIGITWNTPFRAEQNRCWGTQLLGLLPFDLVVIETGDKSHEQMAQLLLSFRIGKEITGTTASVQNAAGDHRVLLR